MKANFHIQNDDDDDAPSSDSHHHYLRHPAEGVTFEIEKTKVAKLLAYICMILWFSPKLY